MSAQASTVPIGFEANSKTAAAATRSLIFGVAGLVVTAIGALMSPDKHGPMMSYLVGVTFWTAVAIGMMMMIFIHHATDAYWSVVIRRQWEHGLAAFKWLLVLFVPLLVLAWLKPGIVWVWMDPSHVLHGHETVASDVVYQKKSAFLNVSAFTWMTVGYFLIWIWLSARLRKASFTQDADGNPNWTRKNRWTSAVGLIVGSLTLTFASFYWIKSLEYHWFSTMFGVWFFANCARAALSFGVIIMVWLYHRGDYKGIINRDHFHAIGQMMLAFTVFWAYVTFSQYFLIWNANVPEETFWYNLRELNLNGETNQWWYVGLLLLFGHFVLPFCALLSYRYKVTPHIIRRIAYWILFVILIDLCYNALPALKDAHGDPQPFVSINLLWVLTSMVGVGGICIWAYLRSFSTTRLIPIRDPRVDETLNPHESLITHE
jgi:hypothetical protein